MLSCQEFAPIPPGLTITPIQCYGPDIFGIVLRRSGRSAPCTNSLPHLYRAPRRRSGSRPRSTAGGRSRPAPHWSRSGRYPHYLVTMNSRRRLSHALPPDPIILGVTTDVRIGSSLLTIRHSCRLGLSGLTHLGPLFACYPQDSPSKISRFLLVNTL